jgi:hypothetical protein
VVSAGLISAVYFRQLAQIGSLARRARLSLPFRPAGGPAEENFGLTAREIEVLRLVSEGRGNRDIAAELFISAKTASVMCRTSWPSSTPPAAPRQQPSPTGPASPMTAPERLAPESPRGCQPLRP